MPLYRYQALNRAGKSLSGTIDAASLSDAKEMLNSRGLLPTTLLLTTVTEEGKFSFKRMFERSVDQKTILVFTKQLGVLLKSGIPLLAAIDLLAKQFEGRFSQILAAIKDDLAAGKSFADSLAKYPKLFSSVYIQLVRAGEASGKLENIIERLYSYLETEAETKKRIKKAMTYPIFMLSFALLVTLALIMGLVPMFASMFTEMKVQEPTITKILMSISNFLWSYGLYLIGGIILFIMWFWYWKSTPTGKRRLDVLLLKLPVLSYFTKTRVVVQFSKTLGMLLDAGVNLAEALDIVCNIVDNSVLVDTLKGARDNIIKQGKIAYYLEQTKIFPAMANYMISTGEQSGELAQMLIGVGRDYEIELQEFIDSIIAKINPVMLVILGLVVILMIAGIFLPMFDAMSDINKRVQ